MRTLLPRTGRRVLLASAAVIALAAAGIAIAGPGGPASTSLVSATFFAKHARREPHADVHADRGRRLHDDDALFTGTASSSDPRLAGPITVRRQERLRHDEERRLAQGQRPDIDSTDDSRPVTSTRRLTAVNVNGVVQGWLDGDLGDGAHFMGSFSGTFSRHRRLRLLRRRLRPSAPAPPRTRRSSGTATATRQAASARRTTRAWERAEARRQATASTTDH